MLYFNWDEEKAKTNLIKHEISFEDAESVFDDANGLLIYDESDQSEDRYALLGISTSAKLLVVVHCYRSDDNEIRIISARKASKSESNQYVRQNYER